MWFSVFTQDYTADVNVIPTQRFINPSVMLGKIQPEKALELVLDGEEHTWPHIERIRNSTTVGAKLDQILLRLTDKIAIGSRPKPRQSGKGSVRSIARGTPANE